MKRFAMLCAILACGCAAALRADSAQDVHDLFQGAADSLADGKANGFMAAFDPAMPGFAKLRNSVAALLKESDARSTIEWGKNEGGDQDRKVQLNWLLEITERGAGAAVTHRKAQVECELKNRSSEWRIVSFAPADLFNPPRADEAWNLLVSAAEGLTEAATPISTDETNTPRANTKRFMDAFDPEMTGYAQLRDSVLGMEQKADVESSLDLIKNEGDDRVRTIQVDWSLNLVAHDTSISAVRRAQTVTCRVEKQGNRWRITSIEPVSLFSPQF